MCPVPLSTEQWDIINATLPDVESIRKRIEKLTPAEWLEPQKLGVMDLVSQLRLSRACIHDASRGLYNARYALGQAIGVRQHFMSLSKEDRDNNHYLADLRSRFYADYVSLLLYTTIEHSLKGIIELHKLKVIKKKRDYLLIRVCKAVEKNGKLPAIYSALVTLDNSSDREKVCKYRNDWVHNEPRKIESLLPSPRRRDGFIDSPIGEGGKMIMLGATYSDDYTWEELLQLLKGAMVDITAFLGAFTDEWKRVYNKIS